VETEETIHAVGATKRPLQHELSLFQGALGFSGHFEWKVVFIESAACPIAAILIQQEELLPHLQEVIPNRGSKKTKNLVVLDKSR
jgi:hypothetical protein